MRPRLACVTAVAAATLMFATACGGSPVSGGQKSGEPTEAEAVFKEMAALDGQERRDKLVEAAEDEGELTIYTSMTDDIALLLEKEFEADFDVAVDLTRAESTTVLTKVLKEYSSNYAGADIVETNALELFALNSEGALAEYSGERRDMVGEQGQFENWTATRYNIFAPSWNTTAVSAEEAPKSWEDLADPKWNGRLAMELSDYDWYLTLYGYWQEQGKSDEEIDKLFADMVDGAEVQKGHTTMSDLHVSGKFDVAATNYTYIVQQKINSGAPLAYEPIAEPAIARPNGFGLVRNASHPAAAMLFADWMLEEGQQVLIDLGLTPAIVPEGAKDPMEGVEVIPVDTDKMVNENEKWTKAYDDLLRGAGGAGR